MKSDCRYFMKFTNEHRAYLRVYDCVTEFVCSCKCGTFDIYVYMIILRVCAQALILCIIHEYQSSCSPCGVVRRHTTIAAAIWLWPNYSYVQYWIRECVSANTNDVFEKIIMNECNFDVNEIFKWAGEICTRDWDLQYIRWQAIPIRHRWHVGRWCAHAADDRLLGRLKLAGFSRIDKNICFQTLNLHSILFICVARCLTIPIHTT